MQRGTGRRTASLHIVLCFSVLPACTLFRPTMPVYAENPCDTNMHVRFAYDDSGTLAAGGDEQITFPVPANERVEGPHPIGEPATPDSILFLEVFRDPSYVHRVATRQYDGVLPEQEVDGQRTLLLRVPTTACKRLEA